MLGELPEPPGRSGRLAIREELAGGPGRGGRLAMPTDMAGEPNINAV
jgi:hypothetical protein